MNPITLDSYNKLRSENNSIRLNVGVTLINHLRPHNTKHADNKELSHALVRLVRSLGSSTVFARRGFYSTLTVFLTLHPETSIEKLLSIMNTQLHPTGSNTKKENAGICMGRILCCGALIRSKLLIQNSIEIQRQIIEDLLNAGEQRSHLSFVSVMFLSEFIVQLDKESMQKVVWPIVEQKFGKSWVGQTLDSFYILLVIRDKYPSLVDHKFLKEHLGVTDIIAEESVQHIVKLLMGLPRIVSCHHPVFELFFRKLTSTKFVADFWRRIDEKFTSPSRHDEHIAIHILRLILVNITDKTIIPSLLSRNLLCHMLRRFSNCKKNNNDDTLVAFREVLNLIACATNDEDVKIKTKLSILKKLILYPSDLMIEKKTGTKVVQIITGNLKLDGIKKLCQLYRDIIANKMAKERENAKMELWTNAERSYAAHLLTRLMGHLETFSDQAWRLAQLIFLFNYGLCRVSSVGTELAPQFKDSFYRALDYKLPKLNDVRNLLSALVHDLNSKLQSNAIQLRSPLSDAAYDAWGKVINFIEKLKESTRDTEALPIFHTMNLHMGLQLFSDPEMAITSINELACCYERLIKKSKRKDKVVDNVSMEEEPHWVEVIMDLLLSFLSKNNHLLRSLVSCVFPHICPYLTLSAVYQILDVLDIKNNQDALIVNTRESEDENDSSEDAERESINDVDNTEEDVSSEEGESESNSEDPNEDETLTDRLRVAVRQALGDAATQTDDEDIDVDEIDDDQAKRLNDSLAAAFKILRENRQARSKKQEKTSQVLTHFRIRVIDLLDIYLETCPSMAITLDIIVPLFVLLEFCIKDPHQKPLEHRVRSCLRRLSAVKRFDDTADVNDNTIMVVLKTLIEKGERSVSVCQEMNDKLAECCTFLVRCTQQANLSAESIVEIYVENLTAFFRKRDCVLSSILFKDVLQLCWEENWQLASALVGFAFDSNIRYFRRSQALELLLVFYNNNRLVCMNTKYFDVRIKLETMLCNNSIHTFELHNRRANNNERSISCGSTHVRKKVEQKFISLLLTLLRIVHAHHLPQAWDWQNIRKTLIIYRDQSVLSKDAKNAYNKLATQIGVPLDASTKRYTSESVNLGSHSVVTASSDNGERRNNGFKNGEASVSNEKTGHDSDLRKRKKKSKREDKLVLKKEARELRARVMSKGLERFDFSSINMFANQTDVMEIPRQNENSHDELASSKLSRKRICEQSVQGPSLNDQIKRRRSANYAR